MGKKQKDVFIIDHQHSQGVNQDSEHVSSYTSNYEQPLNHHNFSVGGRSPFWDLAGQPIQKRVASPIGLHVNRGVGVNVGHPGTSFEANFRQTRGRVANPRFHGVPTAELNSGVQERQDEKNENQEENQGVVSISKNKRKFQ